MSSAGRPPNAGAWLLSNMAAARAWGRWGPLARRLKVDSTTVRRWALGARVPGPEMRARLESVLGIPWRAWDDDASLEDGPGLVYSGGQ